MLRKLIGVLVWSAITFFFIGAMPSTASAQGQDSAPMAQMRPFSVASQHGSAGGVVAVDAQGGQHLAYVRLGETAAEQSAVYVFCDTACAESANWHGVVLSAGVLDVQLALTADGRPRLMIHTISNQANAEDWVYAECNSDCTNSAGWALVTVATTANSAAAEMDGVQSMRSFALDTQGRPRLVYQDRNNAVQPARFGLFYAGCDGNCTVAANWHHRRISRVIEERGRFDYEVFVQPVLTITPQDQPRVLAKVYPLHGERAGIYLFGCADGCSAVDEWSRHRLADNALSWDLTIDAQGMHHVGIAEPENRYLRCAGGCFSNESWTGAPIAAAIAIDLAVDPLGRPQIAQLVTAGAVAYAWCDGDCVQPSNWLQEVIDPAPTCAAARPVLALGRAGQSHIVYSGLCGEVRGLGIGD